MEKSEAIKDSPETSTSSTTNMDKNIVKKNISDNTDCPQNNEDVLNREKSNNTEAKDKAPNVKQPTISGSTLKELDEEHFIKFISNVKDTETKPHFYCEVCCAIVEKLSDTKRHINGKNHRKNRKTKGPLLTLRRIPKPTVVQIVALEAMLESVIMEHALDPDKDLPIRLQITEELSKFIQSRLPGSSLTLYGSSETCFGFKTSDVNLDLCLPEDISVPQGLMFVFELLQTNDQCVDLKDEFALSIPQISFIHIKSGLICRLSCGNQSACKTSNLLERYAKINPVVSKLIVGFRFWAKSCCIDNKSDGGLTPYCFALMVIQFLQCVANPVLPRLGKQEDATDKVKFNSSNTASLGLLWFQLFRYYCLEFKLDDQIITIRVKQPFYREDRRWGHRRFAIEDPIITSHNVSTVNSDRVFEYIIGCMASSFLYYGTAPKPKNSAHVPCITTKLPSDQPSSPRKGTMDENDGVEVYEEDESAEEDKSQTRISKTGKTVRGSKNAEEDIFEMDDLEEDKEGKPSTSDNVKNKSINHDKDAADTSLPDLKNATTQKFSDMKICPDESDLKFEFKVEVLTGGHRPEVQCQCCKKDGHVSSQCPDLKKPILKPLPQLKQSYLDILSGVCIRARDVIAFAPQEMKFRESVLWNLEDYIQEVFPDSRLHLFGSSMNGFGFRESDLDICMTVVGKSKEDIDCINIIKQLAKKLKQHRDCGSVVAITTAKVPIVKFFLRSVKREADISLYNILALENTRMLATYAHLNERVSILGYTLKLFAKVCDIGDASKGSLSSYAYILMLLHYLQKRDPPVIPVLQELYDGDTQPTNIVDNWNCWFYEDISNLSKVWKPASTNQESIGSLWVGFLRYYTETFDWEHEVVCCRRSKKLTKFEKMWTRHIFAIEDPFNLDHNLGAGISRKMGTFIRSAFARGRDRFGNYPPPGYPPQHLLEYFFHADFLTNGCEAPSDRTCRVCGHIGHIARECPRLKKNRREDNRCDNDDSKLSNRPFAAPNVTPRKRASTAPPTSVNQPNMNQPTADSTTERHVGSLPNDPLHEGSRQSNVNKDSQQNDRVATEVGGSQAYDHSFPGLLPTPPRPAVTANQAARGTPPSTDRIPTEQRADPREETRNIRSHPNTPQERAAVSAQVGISRTLASSPSRSTDTNTTNAPSNRTQGTSPLPGFAHLSLNPAVTSAYGVHTMQSPPVQLIPPGQFSAPPQVTRVTHTLSSSSPQHFSGHVPNNTNMFGAKYPVTQTQPIHMQPTYPLRGVDTTRNAWPASPHVYQQARNSPTGQPYGRHRSASESMASAGTHHDHLGRTPDGNPPPMLPFDTPPPVYRNQAETLYGIRPGALQGYPHYAGSPVRHPSSLPSYFQSPPPNKTGAHLMMQNSPQPHPRMSPAHGGHMSGEDFFKMLHEAEQQKTRTGSEATHRHETVLPIPTSDAVLSHPVASPIFKPPKTAAEQELFSKLNKVRGLWTSNADDTGNKAPPFAAQPTSHSASLPNHFKQENSVSLQSVFNANQIETLESCLPRKVAGQVATEARCEETTPGGILISTKSSETKPSQVVQPAVETSEQALKESPAPQPRNEEDLISKLKPAQQQQRNAENLTSNSPGKRRGQEKSHGKQRRADEAERSLFELKSFQKAFPSGEVDVETEHEETDSLTQQPQKQNKSKTNQSSPPKRKGSKKGETPSKGISTPPKRRRSAKHEGSQADSSAKEDAKALAENEQEIVIDLGSGTHSPQTLKQNKSRTPRRKAKSSAEDPKVSSSENAPGEVSSKISNERKGVTTSPPKHTNRNKRQAKKIGKESSSTEGKESPSSSQVSESSSPSQTPPTRLGNGQKNSLDHKTERGKSQGKDSKASIPVAKKGSPTSKSEDSGEDCRSGEGTRRKSKGRGRGRGRGKGQTAGQSQPGPGNDGQPRDHRDSGKSKFSTTSEKQKDSSDEPK